MFTKSRLQRSYCPCMMNAWNYVSVALSKKSMHMLIKTLCFYDASTGDQEETPRIRKITLLMLDDSS